jgi:signal transduction histidine kinase
MNSEDASVRKEPKEDLRQEACLRDLLIEITADFINIPLEQVDEKVNLALKKMAQFVNADRSYTFDYDWDKDVCNNTYEWCAPGITPEIGNLQNLPLYVLKEWVVAHKKGESMYIHNVLDLPDGIGKDVLVSQGIKSFITVPMLAGERCIGFVGFDSVRDYRYYSDNDQQILKVFGQVLANVKMRREMINNLVVAIKKAEESNRLKTAFIQNISHEIRTPLNGILGFSQLIVDETIPQSERKQYFKLMQQNSDRLLQTITNIMDISEITAGSIIPVNESVHIGMVLNDLSENLISKCLTGNVEIITKIPAGYEELRILTDQKLFTKILTQLLCNAQKFTEEGSITFGFEVSDELVTFFVKDTGKGISADKLDSIFKPFIQEDISITRAHEGNGLGLPIAKGLVELLGGKLWVESEPKKGTIFYITLPRVVGLS